MDNRLFWKIFKTRCILSLSLSLLLFFSCILRVAVIAVSDYSEIAERQNSLRIKIQDLRGTIFDCNMTPITNNTKKIIACVSPTPRAVTALSSVLRDDELDVALERLRKGKPIICEVPEYISCDGIYCTEIFVTENNTAVHTLGYVNSDGNGVMGLQKAYNEVLKSDSEVYVSYECNGLGEILEGATPKIENNTSIIANGVVSTIDLRLQSISENITAGLETGAVIIAETKTNKIRALVSKPLFDTQNISEYLDSPDSPLLNRAISAYNVGSVFKPCVAVAGLESGINNFHYTCTGSCEIIDRVFKCHKLTGHGYLDLEYGLANSCNTFFYNYAFKIGSEKILKTASVFQFGNKINLCDGIVTNAGNIPSAETLNNQAQLANFSIGQGELLLSPVSILPLYSAIAGGGEYYLPSIVEGVIENGEINKYKNSKPTRAMSEKTANTLREYLKTVLNSGTGESAKPKNITAAGKTATAQTGKFINGVEINQGWFCGFFPADNPIYTVIVFSENTLRQEKTCNQIFSEIADEISLLF